MRRTLMQLGIGALEEMFATSKTDAKVLKQLENELQHRQVPRAVALLEQVQLTMTRGASTAQSSAQHELAIEPSAAQPLALFHASQAHTHKGPAPALVATAPVPQPTPPNVPLPTLPLMGDTIAAPTARVERAPMPLVSLEDAFKLLKVTLASSWLEVELSRRNLVLLSHPLQWSVRRCHSCR